MIKHYQSGFTIVEVLIAALIMTVIGAAVLSVQYLLGNVQITAFNSAITVDQANSAISIMSREIRQAQSSDTGSYPLELTNDNELIIYSDIDYDGQSERVHYSLIGNTLSKSTIKPVGSPAAYPPENETTLIITDYVNNQGLPVFTYLNGGWPQDLTNNPLPLDQRLSQTRLIRIYLNLNSSASQRQDYALEAHIQLRSLKDNL